MVSGEGDVSAGDEGDAAEADEDGGGGEEKYEIKALRKTVGSGGKVKYEKDYVDKTDKT